MDLGAQGVLEIKLPAFSTEDKKIEYEGAVKPPVG